MDIAPVAVDQFRALVSNIPGMVCRMVLVRDGILRFSYLSEGTSALLGIGAATLHENPLAFLEMLHPEDRPSFEQAMRESASGFTTWNWEGRIRVGPEKEIKWINLRATPSKTLEETVWWQGIVTNITQSKLARIELEQSRQALSELSSHLQKVKELERANIAREIHDEIGGLLTAVKIDLSHLATRLPQDEEFIEKVRAILALVDQAIETTGRISRNLRPALLDFGIVPAIEWQTQEFEKRMGITCKFTCASEDIAAEPDHSIALFRIFQETLTNISKHAGATEVTITLEAADEHMRLEVRDNGYGMDGGDMLKPDSFGIRGMIARAHHLGGNLTVRGNAGTGTTVTVVLPRVRWARDMLPGSPHVTA